MCESCATRRQTLPLKNREWPGDEAKYHIPSTNVSKSMFSPCKDYVIHLCTALLTLNEQNCPISEPVENINNYLPSTF